MVPMGNTFARKSAGVDRRGTLLYDQDCGICTATAAWLARRVTAERLGLLGIGSVASEPAIAPLVEGRPLASSVHFVRVDGTVLNGARAVLAAGRLVPRWRWLATGLDHRVGHVLLEPVYRLVADHRQRIGRLLGLPAACAMPPRLRDPR